MRTAFLSLLTALLLIRPAPSFAESSPPIKFGAEIEYRDVATHRVAQAITAVALSFGMAAPLVREGAVTTSLAISAVSAVASYVAYVGGLNLGHHGYSLPKLRRHFENTAAERDDLAVRTTESPGFKVGYPDGFWIEFLLDPAVIEGTHTPITTGDLRRRLDEFQRDAFDHPASVGIHPTTLGNLLGATHLSIDLESAFGNDALLFRNFLVDFANHSEIATGVLNYDMRNAPPLNHDLERREVFARIIKSFDDGEIRTIDELTESFQRRVLVYWQKNGALSLINAQPDQPRESRRVEIRSMRPIRSAADLLKMFELFEGRIQYLKTLSAPLPYIDCTPIYGAEEGAKEFHRYVTESGKRWANYLPLLPRRYRGFGFDEAGEVISRPSFLSRCANALTTLVRF